MGLRLARPGPHGLPCGDVPSLCSVQTVLRVWDCLFNEGSKIIFRVALTLVKQHQAFILGATSAADVCEKFKEITRGTFVTECHTFMQVSGGCARPLHLPVGWVPGFTQLARHLSISSAGSHPAPPPSSPSRPTSSGSPGGQQTMPAAPPPTAGGVQGPWDPTGQVRNPGSPSQLHPLPHCPPACRRPQHLLSPRAFLRTPSPLGPHPFRPSRLVLCCLSTPRAAPRMGLCARSWAWRRLCG